MMINYNKRRHLVLLETWNQLIQISEYQYLVVPSDMFKAERMRLYYLH